MRFLKVGILFAASTLSKLIAGLLIVKIVAIYLGAQGLGQLGQFMSLMSMITILAGGGINTGIIKYVAEFEKDERQLNGYLRAASMMTLAVSILLGAALLLGASQISLWLFNTNEYAVVIRVLAACQFAIAFTNLLMGVLNGHKRVHAFAVINAVSVVIGAAGVALGCALYGMKGAMYGLIWMPSCTILLLLPWYRFGLKFSWRRLLPQWDRQKIKQFAGYSMMIAVTVLTMQMSQIVIRYIIAGHNSWVEVGYWKAVSKISDSYLLFITVVLSNYYLPRLSALRSRLDIKKEVTTAYKIAMPVLLLMSITIFILRDWIILLLFSPEFLAMKSYFTWQLAGDAFKVAAYISGYVAVAKANSKLYIAAELFQSSLLILLCYFFVNTYGAIGATYAYFTTYFIYFPITFAILRYYLSQKDTV
jgi:O-antigen/teichoic acid export membrane protein